MERTTDGGDFKYKIILLGAVGVGKTSIFNRLRDGKFTPNATEQTQGTDIFNCTRTVGNDRVQVSKFYIARIALNVATGYTVIFWAGLLHHRLRRVYNP